MEDYGGSKELKERVMKAAPTLEHNSSLSMNGMAAFTIDDLARELDMDDAEHKRLLTIAVGQLVQEGRLIGHTRINDNLSIGSG